MPGSTSIYGLPYLEPDDPPDIAGGLEGLAEAVEDELARIDARPQPVQTENSTEFTFTNTAAAPGSTVVGLAFVAPPTGKVYVTVSGNLQSDQNTHSAALSFDVRTGGTIGSGSLVLSQSFTRAVMTSAAVNTGAGARSGASNRYLLLGLTPGSTYNARCMHWMAPGGGGTIYHRALLVEPVL